MLKVTDRKQHRERSVMSTIALFEDDADEIRIF